MHDKLDITLATLLPVSCFGNVSAQAKSSSDGLRWISLSLDIKL